MQHYELWRLFPGLFSADRPCSGIWAPPAKNKLGERPHDHTCIMAYQDKASYEHNTTYATKPGLCSTTLYGNNTQILGVLCRHHKTGAHCRCAAAPCLFPNVMRCGWALGGPAHQRSLSAVLCSLKHNPPWVVTPCQYCTQAGHRHKPVFTAWRRAHHTQRLQLAAAIGEKANGHHRCFILCKSTFLSQMEDALVTGCNTQAITRNVPTLCLPDPHLNQHTHAYNVYAQTMSCACYLLHVFARLYTPP